MKLTQLRKLLKDKRVTDEIHKHLWIESQKAGYNIGIERATDEWMRLYSRGWIEYNMKTQPKPSLKRKDAFKKKTSTPRKKVKSAAKTNKPKKKPKINKKAIKRK